MIALSETLEFDLKSLFTDPDNAKSTPDKSYNIAVAGTGYVGFSLAVRLAQFNSVTAVDIIPEKAEKINKLTSPMIYLTF